MPTCSRLTFGATALVLLAALLVGCRPAETGTIAIGVRSANDHAPFYIADRHGLYAENGLDVTIQVIASNTEIVEALHRGDLQMGAFPATTAIAAIAQGKPIRIVAMTGRGGDGLLVRADGPTAVSDLRGRRIATIRASILDVLLRNTLEAAGLDPERDVELVYLSQLGELVAALKTGQVDACSNTEPFMTDAESQGWGRILTYYTADWPDHPCCVVVAHDDMLHRREAAVREVLRTHCQAVDWAQTHPAETARIIVDTLGAFDPDVVEASLDPTKMRMDCQVHPDEIARMARLMAAQGIIDEVPPTDSLLDMGPLEAVGVGP
jgi:NitT/TauT family transport system substrate-binding protein